MSLGALHAAPGVTVPAAALRWRAVRSSGPGGQNVNKVASKVELRVAVASIHGLTEKTGARLRRLAGDLAARLTTGLPRLRGEAPHDRHQRPDQRRAPGKVDVRRHLGAQPDRRATLDDHPAQPPIIRSRLPGRVLKVARPRIERTPRRPVTPPRQPVTGRAARLPHPLRLRPQRLTRELRLRRAAGPPHQRAKPRHPRRAAHQSVPRAILAAPVPRAIRAAPVPGAIRAAPVPRAILTAHQPSRSSTLRPRLRAAVCFFSPRRRCTAP